jgi:hypothetical protein
MEALVAGEAGLLAARIGRAATNLESFAAVVPVLGRPHIRPRVLLDLIARVAAKDSLALRIARAGVLA